MTMDWEKLHGELSQATGAWSREELVGLLRDLIREYVIERGLPTGGAAPRGRGRGGRRRISRSSTFHAW